MQKANVNKGKLNTTVRRGDLSPSLKSRMLNKVESNRMLYQCIIKVKKEGDKREDKKIHLCRRRRCKFRFLRFGNSFQS